MSLDEEGNLPSCPKRPHELVAHGDVRLDPYFWLRDKTDPAVFAYLDDENAYTDRFMEPLRDQKHALFNELKAQLDERSASVPAADGDYEYFHRYHEGGEYRTYYRRSRGDDSEQVLLDVNKLAAGREYFDLGTVSWSPDHQLLAYSADEDGAEEYKITIVRLKDGVTVVDGIANTSPGAAWSANSRTLFYVKNDTNHRPYQVWRHDLDRDEAQLVFQEDDKRFFVEVSNSLSGDYIFIHTEGVNTSEIHFASARSDNAQFQCCRRRVMGVEYDVEHQGDSLVILTNEGALDFKVMKASLREPDIWREWVPHRPGRLLSDMLVLEKHLLLFYKEEADSRCMVIDCLSGDTHQVAFPDNIGACDEGSNYEYRTTKVQLTFSSLTRPETVYDYDLERRKLTIRKVDLIPSGYKASEFHCERVFVTASDGARIPVSILAPADLAATAVAPLVLYGYGAYGIGIEPSFSRKWLPLARRGFRIAFAHIRGGDDCGRAWYEAGKLKHKTNTFDDYIACADHFVRAGLTKAGKIVAVGGSAGGMLMGTVANRRPELFGLVCAHVPFVDCVTTMLDESLPLTAHEYNEWGNPNDEEAYFLIKSYSPYDNVQEQEYPPMYVTSGLNDPRVTYWEPTKWVARLRAKKTDTNPLLLRTHMGAGHGGRTGRYARLEEVAEEFAIVLSLLPG